MDKEKNIIDTVKKVADNKENQVDSGLGNFLESLIEVQAEERYELTHLLKNAMKKFIRLIKNEIYKITLENFHQYKGLNTIVLDTSSNKPVNIIVGENGAGKSNFLLRQLVFIWGHKC